MVTIVLGQDETRFELGVVGYQFPAATGSDGNWLMIHIRVACAEGSWECTDPMLETSDLPLIASWLEAIAEGDPVRERLHFTEPNLVLRFLESTGETALLRVYFDMEARPPWANQPDWIDQFTAEADKYVEPFIALNVTHEELRQAATTLREAIANWPVR